MNNVLIVAQDMMGKTSERAGGRGMNNGESGTAGMMGDGPKT